MAFGGEDDWQADVATVSRQSRCSTWAPHPRPRTTAVSCSAWQHAGSTPVLMLIDQAGFARRFDAERLRQRRQAWQALADTLQARAVFVDLQSPDLAAAEAALLQPRST